MLYSDRTDRYKLGVTVELHAHMRTCILYIYTCMSYITEDRVRNLQHIYMHVCMHTHALTSQAMDVSMTGKIIEASVAGLRNTSLATLLADLIISLYV
jgi:hypothetical protein